MCRYMCIDIHSIAHYIRVYYSNGIIQCHILYQGILGNQLQTQNQLQINSQGSFDIISNINRIRGVSGVHKGGFSKGGFSKGGFSLLVRFRARNTVKRQAAMHICEWRPKHLLSKPPFVNSRVHFGNRCTSKCPPTGRPACLPACLSARRPACLPAHLPACRPAGLPACLSARLPARLPACLPAAAGWSDQLHGGHRQAGVHHRRQIQPVPRTLPLPPACLPICAVGLLG